MLTDCNHFLQKKKEKTTSSTRLRSLYSNFFSFQCHANKTRIINEGRLFCSKWRIYPGTDVIKTKIEFCILQFIRIKKTNRITVRMCEKES